jgi:2'-5' RNA ligase
VGKYAVLAHPVPRIAVDTHYAFAASDGLGVSITRYFFASFPTPTEASTTLQRASVHDAKRSFVRPHKLHLTWAYLASRSAQDSELEREALFAGDRLDLPGFEIRLDEAAVFGDDVDQTRPHVLCASSWPETYTAAAGMLRALSDGDQHSPFRAHVTVSYRRPIWIPSFKIDPVSWRVSSVDLLRSAAGTYTTMRRWSLA